MSVVPQPIVAPLTHAAIFLVVTLKEGAQTRTAVRGLAADLSGLLRAVGFRDLEDRLSCVMAIGSDAWDRIFEDQPRPPDLHPFREIHGTYHAPSTPGDLLFHIRATRQDLCFEMATHLMERLDGVVASTDEVHGFKYFDQRDLLGFVDGTENPVGAEAAEHAVVGQEAPALLGGSYVIIQKYLHDLKAWNQVPVETQELIVGRKKLSDIELLDDVKPSYAHNALTSLDVDGKELKIVRDNMPFGDAGQGMFGTYFIGYAREPGRIETMLQRMFIGDPPGNHDRLLDYSRAVTGCLFFAPSASFLDAIEG